MKFLGCLLMMLVTQTLSDQKILSLPGGQTGPAPCARTCSGVSSYKETTYRWTDTRNGIAYKGADITECGFVTTPVVTAILRGPGHITPSCPSIRVWYVNNTRLYFMTVENATPSNMVYNKCDVYWIATGYVC